MTSPATFSSHRRQWRCWLLACCCCCCTENSGKAGVYFRVTPSHSLVLGVPCVDVLPSRSWKVPQYSAVTTLKGDARSTIVYGAGGARRWYRIGWNLLERLPTPWCCERAERPLPFVANTAVATATSLIAATALWAHTNLCT
uniref:Secreted protein n=1 Tax=Anopheles atroparvus TaxID=41427 RepID=A0AAG5DY27_ANOAO